MPDLLVSHDEMYIVCPNHRGSFDCNPFCNFCEGEQEVNIAEIMNEAKGIAFDTCHKIYVLMDDEQMALMKQYGYDPLISSDEMSPHQMFKQLMEWFEDSCALKFINAVYSDERGFVDIIPQFAFDRDEDEEDEDEEEWWAAEEDD